ncbi:Ribosomal RNA large subunit methyltransferase J [Bienertia sinuspersici]
MGSCYYLLQEVKRDTWYEVLSALQIPVMFSLQLKRAISDVGMNGLRESLNTEKLILKAEDLDGSINLRDLLQYLMSRKGRVSCSI